MKMRNLAVVVIWPQLENNLKVKGKLADSGSYFLRSFCKDLQRIHLYSGLLNPDDKPLNSRVLFDRAGYFL